MSTSGETVPVTFTVSDLRHSRGTGRLLALATVRMDLGGIEIELHGVQVLRLANGRIRCQAPQYRSHTGEWKPAISMPPELEDAIGRTVLKYGGFAPNEE